MAKRHPRTTSKPHEFGGDWTERKLTVLSLYLEAYTTALKDKRFTKIYIDAFAGSGYRSAPEAPTATHGLPEIVSFFGLDAAEPEQLLEGSAKRALRTVPAFDRYIFIERSAARVHELQVLKGEFAHLESSIEVVQGDANTEIQRLCTTVNWRSSRAVLFLDPYGMQVEWKTIAAIARTRAIDLWLLFPLGVAVNRLITQSGQIPPGWVERLNLLFGTVTWRDRLYQTKTTPSLFEDVMATQTVKASIDVIGEYFLERLRGVFAGVADHPLVLRNSTKSPLYLFCFAAANKRGAPIALKIANHILGMEP